MDSVREIGPFILGLLLPPVFMIAIRTGWSGGAKFALSFATSLVIGLAISYFAGDLVAGLASAVPSVLVNTSLIFTGSQLAYWSFWRPVLEQRQRDVPATERVGRRR